MKNMMIVTFYLSLLNTQASFASLPNAVSEVRIETSINGGDRFQLAITSNFSGMGSDSDWLVWRSTDFEKPMRLILRDSYVLTPSEELVKLLTDTDFFTDDGDNDCRRGGKVMTISLKKRVGTVLKGYVKTVGFGNFSSCPNKFNGALNQLGHLLLKEGDSPDLKKLIEE